MTYYARAVLLTFLSGILFCCSRKANAAEMVRSRPASPAIMAAETGAYFWTIKSVGQTAQLVTLNCRHCAQPEQNQADVPLLSILRDTLGVASPENDRLSYFWLLSSGRFSLGQRILSAVPFFYWRLGNAGTQDRPGHPSPLIDVSAPLHPVLTQAGRSILQWMAFDPLSTSVRAASRSYQANQADNERLRLEQAIGYLQNAPCAIDRNGLSEKEVNTVVARLELRKSLLGGLLNNQRAAEFGQQSRFTEARICSRNFEALRQFAEKTGTYFEPLTLANDPDRFGILWFALNASKPATGTSDKPIWKLLNIRNPWSDPAIANWHGFTVQRFFDYGGHLLPAGSSGQEAVTMVPLGVYSLSYPEMPLLLLDFRDKLHVRRNEMVQRAITEFTGGVLGLSHFANWYYYAGVFAYNTIWARRGIAANEAGRLDCYAQFRMQLALDRELDPELRRELVRRAGSLNVNPLDSDPASNLTNARIQYARLARAAEGNKLLGGLDRDRRAELAAFGQSAKASMLSSSLHLLSFGVYTSRVSEDAKNLKSLERDRRVAYQLDFLDAVTANGTDPRVAFAGVKIDAAVSELTGLLIDVKSPSVLQRAQETLARVQTLSREIEENAASKQTIDTAVIRR